MAKTKTLRRRLIVIVGSIAAIVISLVLIAYGVLQTPWAKERLADAAESALSKDGERSFEIGKVSGAGLATLVLENISMSDAAGIWVELREARIDWHPLALLLGTLSIDVLETQGLHVMRAPQSESSEPFRLPAVPTLPLDIVVDRFELQETVIESAFAGDKKELDGDGSLIVRESTGFDVTFEAAEQGSAEPIARIESTYDRRNGTLALDASLVEAPGGFIGQTLGVPADAAFSLAANGDGPVESWRGRIDLRAGSIELAALDLQTNPAEGGQFIVSGSVSPGLPWTDQLRKTLAGPYQVSASAMLSNEQIIRVSKVNVQNDAALLSMDGVVNLEEQEIDVSAVITMEDADAIAELLSVARAKQLILKTEITGSVTQPFVSLSAQLDEISSGAFSSPRLTASAAFDASLGLDRPISLSLDGSVEKLAVNSEDENPINFEDVTWVMEAKYDTTSRELTLTQGDITNRYASAVLEGTANVATPGSPELAVLISSTIDSLPIDNDALREWFSAPAEIRAGVSRNSAWEEEWKLENIELSHPNLVVRSDFSFSQETSRLNGRYNVTLRNIAQAAAILGIEAEGDELFVTGEIDKTSSQIVGATQAAVSALTIAGTDLQEIDVQLNLQRDGGPLTGTVAGSLKGPLGPTNMSARIVRDELTGPIEIKDAQLIAGTNSLTGNLKLDRGGSLISGKLDGELTSLRELSEIFGQRLAGNLTFSSSLTNLAAAPQVEVRAEGSRLSGDVPGFGVVSARTLSLRATSAAGSADNRVRFELNGDDVDRDRVHFDELKISGTTNGENTQFAVNGTGFFEGELNVQASGSVERQSKALVVALKNVSAFIQGDRWTLSEEVHIERNPSRTSITPFVLTSGVRRIAVDAMMADQSLTAKISANDVPLQLVALFSPRYALGGTMNGTADLNARHGASSGTLNLEIKNLRPRGIVGDTESLTGSVKGDWNGTQLMLQGRLKGQQDGVIDLTAVLPLTYTAEGFAAPGDQPLSGEFEWRADIAPLWQIVQPDLHTLSGAVNADIALAGTIDQPQLTGAFILRDGTYRHLEFGTILNALGVDVDLQNQVLTIRQGTGKTSNGGIVRLDGRIQVDPARRIPARLEFNFDNAELVQRDDIKGSATGSFVYERDETVASFSGSIKSETIEAKLVGGLPANVVDLQVIEVGGARLPEQSNEEDVASTEFAKTNLEVNVSVPGQAFVRGRGLDSEWAGNLRIKGTLATPIITGQLRVVRGRFDFASRAFDLNGGTLTFEGTEKIDPRLNLQATYQDGDFTAATRVSGPSSNPAITLSSSPSLPDDEILARILFGNSVSELSALEALQLAEAARSLSSGGSGGVGGLIGATRDTLGLDVLRIGTAGEEAIQPSITGGKYLTKKIYLELETDPSRVSDRVTLEVDVTKNIAVESELTSETGSNIGIKWQWDY